MSKMVLSGLLAGGLALAGAVVAAQPSVAQSIEIGPGGPRIDMRNGRERERERDEFRREERRDREVDDRREERREFRERRERRERRDDD